MEYVKSAGATNNEGPTDTLFREGLGYYWDQYYSSAIPKFEEVKRLFPQHSEVDGLIQSSQQAKAEGKEKSSFPLWVIGVILAVLFIILLIIIIAIVAIVMMRRRRKAKALPGTPSPAGSIKGHPASTPAHSPLPGTGSAAAPATGSAGNAAHRPAPPPPMPPVRPIVGRDDGMTVDLSRTIAIGENDRSFGSIRFVSGPLSGQRFEIKADGEFIGRDGGSSQIVIGDPRISKRHVWIGVKNGIVIIEDQNSRNGTFLNDPKSERVTETALRPGDTVILGESDVARFEFHA